MSADAVLWIVMAFCLIVGCPIFVSLGVASTLALILTNIPMRIVALDMLKVMDMFPLLAVVGFIFAGALMEKGGMAPPDRRRGLAVRRPDTRRPRYHHHSRAACSSPP